MKFILKILEVLLKLRYKIKVTGLDKIKKNTPQVFFPSHIALVDPIILFPLLAPHCEIHPVVTSSYAENRFLKPLFKWLGAVSIGDFEADQGSKDNIKEVMNNLFEQLKQDQSILLYPQGALARQGFQVIRGKKTAYYLVKEAPQKTQFFTISIKGLWGSRSSYARTGKSPNLFLFLLKGLFFTIINLIFFIPKRTVTINIENATKDLQNQAKKGLDPFNTFLEEKYNAKGEEKLQYLSGSCIINTVKNHHRPEKISGSLEDLQSSTDFNTEEIDEEVFQFVKEKIKEIKSDISTEITLNSNVVLDFFFDSLDVAELKSAVSAKFPKSINTPLSNLKCVGDFVLMAMGKGEQEEVLKPCEWNYQLPEYSDLSSFLENHLSDNANLLEMMKISFSNFRKSHSSFCYDQVFGVQSFDDFLVKVYLIADILKKQVSGKYVGIMLPSLSVTALLISACYFAEKIPVMLNRTQSEQAFDSCFHNQPLKTIFTVKSFYQKLQSPWLEKYSFTFFEELLKDLSLFTKIKALIKSKFFFLPKKLDKTAVILFTSGSESLPKAVPLTHQNLLKDLQGVLGIVRAKFSDILLGALPPFHSFGFTITTILPLITGMRIVFSPDPTDSQQLASLIEHTKASFLPFTPTFLKGVLTSAKDDQISSLNIAVVGAEKASDEVFSLFEKKCPHGIILEGYGITECSPVIAVNPYDIGKEIKKGSVGFPILKSEVFVGDLKTGEKVGPKEEGMIYVSGNFVFPGYMDKKLESPFVTFKKKKYYKTGDLGYFDEEGYLFISGRLKRFVKIAGEMISLPAIEQILFEKYENEDTHLAVEAKENDGKAKFVLFSTKDFDLKEINDTLYQGGIPHLVEIQEVRVLDAIPLLGTGKTDFMKLRNMIEG